MVVVVLLPEPLNPVGIPIAHCMITNNGESNGKEHGTCNESYGRIGAKGSKLPNVGNIYRW